MFKNLILYRIHPGWSPDLGALQDALASLPFVPCSASQEQSAGWVPPRGQEHGALAESVAAQWLLCWQTESRMLPASVVAQRVQEKVQAITRDSGRIPGRKEKRELKDEARLDLLPRAFTQRRSLRVWLDPHARLLAIDSSNQTRADAVTTALVKALPGFALALLDTRTSPQAAMSTWLSERQAPAGFSIDNECELKSGAADKAAVRYARHPLDIDEVPEHIRAGKLPTRLAMSWQARVSFVLTEGLQLRRLALLETQAQENQRSDDDFDANLALYTGELSQMLPALIEALGGEQPAA
ncbi:recombination-associated protein RdgC [Comamonas sp. NLF-1-9]|uniref:recombination-associated protein RdgC n=1 Tax=Comamonas sp. NLF-1-9 TaxID=2853163 RepID=UPI001C46A26F|nr:recombination-associated protein RdgC [Comamonas sp. NLF-1-9]QXL83876.1 recombination-associated protein RdgC [Comamonas sp. NLF-1-9]